jgi:ribosomal protein L2
MLQHNKFKLKKNLTIKKKNEGRSNGRITFNQRGNSTKKHIRQEDTITNIPKSLVIGIEYSPSQTSFLAKVFFKEKNQIKFSYTKCSTRTNLLNTIYPLKKTKAIKNIKKEGNFYKAEDLKVGDIISNVRRNPLENIRFIKSAGTFGQILETNTKKKNYVKILLPSKKQYFISKKSPVLFGRASNVFHSHLKK